MKAVLTLRAASDIDGAAQWYEAEREGLGLEFTDRVLEAVEAIELNPFGYEKRIGDARQCVLSQFLYALWFFIKDDAVIIGCLHGRRDAKLAGQRAAEIEPG